MGAARGRLPCRDAGADLTGALGRDPQGWRLNEPEAALEKPLAIRAAVVVAAAAALVAGAAGLARPGLGYDESASRWAASLPLPDLVRLLRNIDLVHGLYYGLLHAWALVGTDPVWLRVPSVLATAGGVLCVAALTARLTGSAVGAVVAGLVVAAAPSVVYYAQTARSYALVLCFVAAGTLLLVGLLTGTKPGARRPLRWVAYAAVMLIAAWLNELSVLALVAHGVTTLLLRPGRRTVAAWAASAAAVVVLVLPLVIASRAQAAAIAFLQRPGLRDVAALAGADLGASIAAMALVALLALVGAVVPLRGQPHPRAVPAVGVPLLVVPPVILLAASRFGPQSYYTGRYVLYTVGGVALLAGAGAFVVARFLARLARRPMIEPLVALLICVALPATQAVAEVDVRSPQAREFDFGPPTALVARDHRPGDVVLFAGRFFRMAALGYPERFAGVRDIALAVSPAASGTFTGVEAPWPTIRTRALGAQRVWVIGQLPVDPHAARRVGQEATLLTQRFRLVRVQRSKGTTASLWERVGR